MGMYVATTNAYYLKQRRSQRVKVTLFVVILCVVAVVLAANAYWRKMMSEFVDIAEGHARSQITLTVNNTVSEVFAATDYDDFVLTERNPQTNEVVCASANFANVNSFTLQTSVAVQNALSRIDGSVAVPIGTLSGMVLLSGYGASVVAVFDRVNVVGCNLQSEFVSVGINQTLHRIYVNVQADVELLVPGRRKNISVVVPVLICENIIVGQVPSIYFPD